MWLVHVGDHEVQAYTDSPYQQNYDLQFPNTLEPQSYLLVIYHSNIVPIQKTVAHDNN
jgi:hypothetical protein